MSVQVGRHSSVAGVTATTHVLKVHIYMELFMKLQHAIGFTLLCIFRAWPWLMRWILDNIKKISKFMTPCVLVKSGTNTLSKALQVRTVGRGTRFPLLPSLPLPAPTPPPSPPSPTPTLTREHPPCVCTFTNRTNNGESNDIQSLVTCNRDCASLFIEALNIFYYVCKKNIFL